MERKSKRKHRIVGAGGGGGVDGESEGGKGPEATTDKVNCVCRWVRGSGWESHSTTSNHNSWATADRSWRAGQVEGNHIDTGKSWRMLGSHVLREAEEPSGNVKTLADSSEVQPLTFPCIYFIFLAAWWPCVHSGTCWLSLCLSWWVYRGREMWLAFKPLEVMLSMFFYSTFSPS